MSTLPKLEEEFAYVQHESSRRNTMLHRNTTETAAKVDNTSARMDNPAGRGRTHYLPLANLTPKAYWCDLAQAHTEEVLEASWWRLKPEK